MSESCTHEDLLVGSQVDQLESGGKMYLCIKLSVSCDACGMRYSWPGLSSGLPNPNEPVVSADGYELRAPIVPKPGAVVGMLVMAGLEDRLRNPYQQPADE